MILFLGDSFTWGQGLHYYYMIENQGWSWDDCRDFLNTNNRFEKLGFYADEYRRTHSYPYIVSKQLNLPMVTPRFENGGDNRVSYDILKTSLPLIITNTNIDYLIVQFSAPLRSLDNKSDFLDGMSIDEFMDYQIERIDDECNRQNIKWFGISWFKEIGDILKDKYPQNFIPIYYKNKEYESFDFDKNIELRNLTIEHTQYIEDGHFNKEGHQVIANSIINKLNRNLHYGQI